MLPACKERGQRILIVDDDPGIRVLLVTFLGRRGFQMLQATNGREALEMLADAPVDLVLMDLMMPEVNGRQVLQQRLAEPSLLAIPFIVVTATDDRMVMADLEGLHVSAVLSKPFDLDVLMDVVLENIADSPSPAIAA